MGSRDPQRVPVGDAVSVDGGLLCLRFDFACFRRLASDDGGLGYSAFNMIFTCFVLNQLHPGP